MCLERERKTLKGVGYNTIKANILRETLRGKGGDLPVMSISVPTLFI